MTNKKVLAKVFCSVAFLFAMSLTACNSPVDPSSTSGGTPSASGVTPTPSDTFTVTFETRGGTKIDAQSVKSGEKVTKPADPTNPGQIFTGWFQDFDAVTPFDFNSTITSTTVIYAGWVIDRDSFYSGGGGGGGGSTSQPEGEIVYTCTSLPTWIGDAGCVIFAWGWPQGGDGAWYATTLSDTTCTFSVDAELAGFLLVRCVAGTTTPNWEMKSGDAAGRIYNKTDDMTCTSGTYSYACSNWSEYK